MISNCSCTPTEESLGLLLWNGEGVGESNGAWVGGEIFKLFIVSDLLLDAFDFAADVSDLLLVVFDFVLQKCCY